MLRHYKARESRQESHQMKMVLGRKGNANQDLFQSIDSSDSDVESNEKCSRRSSPRGRGRSNNKSGAERDRSRSRARSIAEKVANNLAHVSPRRLRPRLLSAKTPSTSGSSRVNPETGEDSCSIASANSSRDIDNASESPSHCSSSSLALSNECTIEENGVSQSPRRSRFWRPLSPLKKRSSEQLKKNESSSDQARPGLLSVPSLLDGEQVSKHSLLGMPAVGQNGSIKPPSLRFIGAGRSSMDSSGHNSLPAMAFDIAELNSHVRPTAPKQQDENTVSSKTSSFSPKKSKQRCPRSPSKKNRDEFSRSQEASADTNSTRNKYTSSGMTVTSGEKVGDMNVPLNIASASFKDNEKNSLRTLNLDQQEQLLSPKKSSRSPRRSKSSIVATSRSPSEVLTPKHRRTILTDAKPSANSEPVKRIRSRSKTSKQERNRTKNDGDNERSSQSGLENDRRSESSVILNERTPEQNTALTPKTPVRQKQHRRDVPESLSTCLEKNRVHRTPVSGRSVVTEVIRSRDSRSISSDAQRRIRARSVGRRTPRTPRSRTMSRTIQASATPARSATKQRRTTNSTTRPRRKSSRDDASAHQPNENGNNSLAQLHIPSLTQDVGEQIAVEYFEPNLVRSQ